jgi:hypothetical protein
MGKLRSLIGTLPNLLKSALDSPVLYRQALHSIEFARIGGDQNQVSTECLPGKQRVVLANALALPFEFGANLSSGPCILLGIVKYSNGAVQKSRESIGVLSYAATFGDTIPKLMGNNRRGCKGRPTPSSLR